MADSDSVIVVQVVKRLDANRYQIECSSIRKESSSLLPPNTSVPSGAGCFVHRSHQVNHPADDKITHPPGWLTLCDMPKLHLKRTPAEEEARQLRKERKAARKAAKAWSPLKRASVDDDDEGDYDEDEGHRKRQRMEGYTLSDSEETYGPHPHPHATYAAQFQAQLEEERFREKMCEAQEDDAGIYGLEERWNAYPGVRIPERWKGPGERVKGPDPRYMDDEEYAEWIRAEMWKRKHPAEHAEAQHAESQISSRLARAQALKLESERLERAREEERKKRREERERRRREEAWGVYERRWGALGVGGVEGEVGRGLKFEDIPWPVYEANRDFSKRGTLSLDALTSSAISAFILPPAPSKQGEETEYPETQTRNPLPNPPTRKNRLRETLLRFHPDKFEGRVMGRVVLVSEEREKVREGVGRVVRALNELMGDG